MPRYLFGPVDAAFAEEHLHAAIAGGECLAFGHKPENGPEFFIGPTDTWDDVVGRLPSGWSPDFVVLRLDYATVPFGLWSAPIPLIGLARDANLLWTAYRRTLPRCDLVLADVPTCNALKRTGLPLVLPADLNGCGRSWFEEFEETDRDIDILFVGNLHAAVQRERQPWLGRLASLADRWQVRIATGVFGDAYRTLMRRARIVFNRSIRGQLYARVGESISSGALLFQERGNAEVAARLGSPPGCVFYDESDFEPLVERYLGDEQERISVVNAARTRVASLSFEHCWKAAVDRIQENLPEAINRATVREPLSVREGLLLRTGQWLFAADRSADPNLSADLAQAIVQKTPEDAGLLHALGLVRSVGGDVAVAADCFGKASAASKGAVLPAISLIATVAAMGQTQAAVDAARKLLDRLEGDPAYVITGPDLGVFPPLYHHFRVQWERAGFDHAGDHESYARSIRTLLRWRISDLLAHLTDDLVYHYEAVLARPDIPLSQTLLGCALGRAHKPAEAVHHLRAALRGNPLHDHAARALNQALLETGRTAEANQLAEARRLLVKAAPGIIVNEPWFTDVAPISVGEIRVGKATEAAQPSPNVIVPSASQLADKKALRGKVSLCLIVKNEEENLPACLDSAAGLFDEIVVVDTGSQDRTRELAKERGARVSEFPWIDDFAAARNACLERAEGDWIFWLDADDRLDADNRDKLASLLKILPNENVAYAMKCLCVPRDDADGGTVVDHIRLFRRRPDIRWEFRVHEQILGAVRRSGGSVRKADIVIRHVGYVDPALRRRKLERDLRLLEQEEARSPGHPFTLFNLGQVLREMGRTAEALPYLRHSLEQSHPNDSIVRKLFGLLAHCQRELGRPDEALAAINQGLEACPDDAELLFARGILLMEQGDLVGSEGSYRKLLSGGEDPTFTSVADGLRGYQARNNLAAVLQKQGRSAEAEKRWREALAERPGYPPSMLGLGELLLRQSRWDALEEHVSGWIARRPQDIAPTVLRARALMARKEFSSAQTLLEQTLKTTPKDVWVWLVLSHCLLQEGRDMSGAERVLRKVLELDEGNIEVRQNLSLLLRKQAEGKALPR